MKSYLSVRNPNAVIIGIFTLLFLGTWAGVGFENIYVTKLIGLFLVFFPVYIFVLVLKTKPGNKPVRVTAIILFGLWAVLSLPSIFFGIVDTYAVIQNGGIDPAFETVSSTNVGSARVVIYRTNGGATTAFGIVVRAEKVILPGVYLGHDLLNIYGADNVGISLVSSNSIKIDSIDFTDPAYRAEYMKDSPKVTEGTVIQI